MRRPATALRTTRNNDLSGFDLGTSTDFGKNTFQAVFPVPVGGASPNIGTGICLAIDAPTGTSTPQTLSAEGNYFAGKDCTTGTPTLSRSGGCGGLTDVSTAGTTNKIDATTCTIP
jgi:hypothetical protein